MELVRDAAGGTLGMEKSSGAGIWGVFIGTRGKCTEPGVGACLGEVASGLVVATRREEGAT